MLSAARIPTGTLRCAQRDRVPFAVVPKFISHPAHDVDVAFSLP